MESIRSTNWHDKETNNILEQEKSGLQKKKLTDAQKVLQSLWQDKDKLQKVVYEAQEENIVLKNQTSALMEEINEKDGTSVKMQDKVDEVTEDMSQVISKLVDIERECCNLYSRVTTIK